MRDPSCRILWLRRPVWRHVRQRAEYLAHTLGFPAPGDNDEAAQAVGWEVLAGPFDQPLRRLLADLGDGLARGIAKRLQQAHQIHPGVENQSLARCPGIARLTHALDDILPGDIPVAAVVEKQQAMRLVE